MGLITSGSLTILGNFADVQPSKPEDFDYMSDAKWLEVYPFSIRERIGSTVCSCQHVEVHYMVYYGEDYFHLDSCNLMRRLHDRPSLRNLWAWDHLPAFGFSERAVDASVNPGIYVKIVSAADMIKVRISNMNGNQTKLL